MSLINLNNLGSIDVSHEVMGGEGNWTKINSDFFPEVVAHFEWIRQNVNLSDLYKNKEVANGFNRIIKKHTGINAVLSDEYTEFATIPADVNRNNILMDPSHRKYFTNEDLAKSSGQLRSMVDMKNYRISGDFSNIPVKLFISPDFIYSKSLEMSSEELAAAVLHEVGHMFTYFVSSVYTFTTVMPMLSMVNRIMKTDNHDELTLILKEWNNEDSTLTKVDVEELSSKRKEIIVTALISNYVRDVKYLVKHSEYDQINSEYLADKFAARFGAGAYVASMLDKIYTYVGHRSKSSLVGFIFVEIMIGLVGTIQILAPILSGEIVLAIISAGIYIMSLQAGGITNVSDGTYDTITNRYKRIREDLVSMLKDKKIDRAIGNRIRLDIKKIDEVLKTYHNYKSFFGGILDFIIPSQRRIGTQTEFYRQLESLGNNDLFVHAYDLRNL